MQLEKAKHNLDFVVAACSADNTEFGARGSRLGVQRPRMGNVGALPIGIGFLGTMYY